MIGDCIRKRSLAISSSRLGSDAISWISLAGDLLPVEQAALELDRRDLLGELGQRPWR